MPDPTVLFKTLKRMADKWPSEIVARGEVSKFSGGVLTPSRMANLDCAGEGPASIRIGRKICYPVSELIQWIATRAELVHSDRVGRL